MSVWFLRRSASRAGSDHLGTGLDPLTRCLTPLVYRLISIFNTLLVIPAVNHLFSLTSNKQTDEDLTQMWWMWTLRFSYLAQIKNMEEDLRAHYHSWPPGGDTLTCSRSHIPWCTAEGAGLWFSTPESDNLLKCSSVHVGHKHKIGHMTSVYITVD